MADEGTFCTTANVQYKAGANASATSKAEAYTNQFVKEIEGWIMVRTRYDFKTLYATLNAETKELLRLITSNLAAIPVITFDMSGFTTRIEAESMINALWSTALEAMKTLEDQKSVTYATK